MLQEGKPTSDVQAKTYFVHDASAMAADNVVSTSKQCRGASMKVVACTTFRIVTTGQATPIRDSVRD
ncbi:unnamed protein product [Calypogeia fissa]